MDLIEPDVKQIRLAETELRASVARTDEADPQFAIVIADATWTAINEHANTRHDAEVGGVLLGKVCRDARETPYLLIDGHVAALEAESRASNVTFTAETWTKIHAAIDRDFPGASIVGWYHTHPSFGIFLSEMDVFIHRHFFEAPHQVAIVIDPIAKTHGGFAWRAGMPMPQKILVEASEVTRTMDIGESFRRRLRERDAAQIASPPRSLKLSFALPILFVASMICCIALLKWSPLSARLQPRWPFIVFGS